MRVHQKLRIQCERHSRNGDHLASLSISHAGRAASGAGENGNVLLYCLPVRNSALTSGAICNKCVLVMRETARRDAAKARRMIGTARQKVSKWI